MSDDPSAEAVDLPNIYGMPAQYQNGFRDAERIYSATIDKLTRERDKAELRHAKDMLESLRLTGEHLARVEAAETRCRELEERLKAETLAHYSAVARCAALERELR